MNLNVLYQIGVVNVRLTLIKELEHRGFKLYNYSNASERTAFEQKSQFSMRLFVIISNCPTRNGSLLKYVTYLYKKRKVDSQFYTRESNVLKDVFKSILTFQFFELKTDSLPGQISVYNIANSIAVAFVSKYKHQIEMAGLSPSVNNILGFEKKYTASSTLNFKPEHKQAGLQILNYFQETLNQKYPDNDVTVRIGQKGNLVTMEIETPDGKTQAYEKALEDYGLVVTGQMPVEEYLENRVDRMALEQQLRMANMQIENQREILQLKSEVVSSLQEHLSYFKEELRLATRANRFALKELSTVAKIALEKNDPVELFEWMDRVLNDNGPEALGEQLEAIKEENPTLYETILTRANAVVDGAATKVMSSELVDLLQGLA